MSIRYIPAEEVERIEECYTFAIDWLAAWIKSNGDSFGHLKEARNSMIRERGPLLEILDYVEEATVIEKYPESAIPERPPDSGDAVEEDEQDEQEPEDRHDSPPAPEDTGSEDGGEPEDTGSDRASEPEEPDIEVPREPELWEKRGQPTNGDQGWVSSEGATCVMPVGEVPGPTIYGHNEKGVVTADSDDHRPLGERIRERRKLLEMSQEDLSEKVGVSRAMISFIENGQCGLVNDRLKDFAEALFVPKGWLRK